MVLIGTRLEKFFIYMFSAHERDSANYLGNTIQQLPQIMISGKCHRCRPFTKQWVVSVPEFWLPIISSLEQKSYVLILTTAIFLVWVKCKYFGSIRVWVNLSLKFLLSFLLIYSVIYSCCNCEFYLICLWWCVQC